MLDESGDRQVKSYEKLEGRPAKLVGKGLLTPDEAELILELTGILCSCGA